MLMPSFNIVSSDVQLQIKTIINNESDSYTYSGLCLPLFSFSCINRPLAPKYVWRLFELKRTPFIINLLNIFIEYLIYFKMYDNDLYLPYDNNT